MTAQRFWRVVWDVVETCRVPLGRFAPAVFRRAFGLCAPVEVTEAEFVEVVDRFKAEAEQAAAIGGQP